MFGFPSFPCFRLSLTGEGGWGPGRPSPRSGLRELSEPDRTPGVRRRTWGTPWDDGGPRGVSELDVARPKLEVELEHPPRPLVELPRQDRLRDGQVEHFLARQ